MFAFDAIAARSLSEAAILRAATATATSQFDQTSTASPVFVGTSYMIGTSSKTSIAVEVLLGILEASANFTQSVSGEVIGTGAAVITTQFDQTTTGTFVKSIF